MPEGAFPDVSTAQSRQDGSARALLAEVFGFADFRPGQEEIVSAVEAGRDVLAIMPTGGGKSLLYQLPALTRPGVTLVVSPLIALMRDQVRALQAAGVAAGAMTSQSTREETAETFDALDAGRLKLLYMAPERLAAPGTAALLKRVGVALLAVDEAHCVSQWGHDFRPDYLRIGALRASLGGVQTVACTATADADTRAEIVSRLFDGSGPATFLRGFDRPNLALAFRPKNEPRRQLMDFVAARRGRSGIVYCASRARTESLAQAFNDAGHSAVAYHAGLDPESRRAAETRFQREDGLIVCATIAFGMGVDKPDIRYVAHADLPKSIEAYYQEIGRAGRDGAPAETLTLYGPDDIRLRRTQIDEGQAPPERKAADHRRLNALLGLAEAPRCRRQTLLAYFGERFDPPCDNCDLCAEKPPLFDATEAARKAFSAILRTGESFGAEHLIAILRGDATEKVLRRGHERLPTFGVGREFTAPQWKTIFRQLMGLDLIRPDPSRHGALRLTEDARPVLRGEAALELRADSVARAPGRREPVALVAEEDEGLLSALKARRRALADAAGVPAYVVFPDRTLIEMATTRPDTLDALGRITGVGAVKLARYGVEFLAVLTGEVPAPSHPARIRLAANGGGSLYDRLHAAQVALARGPDGLGKPLNCTATTLAKIAEARPRDLAALGRIQGMGPQKVERFGAAFLAILSESAEG
ncbi:DNA helicase RecQ [Amaricoccus sp.]|uniref:DNA helicase RecQ n=1 Tax=Amaricoccus sp. TaxID=1872485 RepID=UPI001B4287FE|nr:DNA helicase RecQ [Amaricoccus sp.]MBP7240623.1 DNA helicase RecQ [Amaricoccus sp.]